MFQKNSLYPKTFYLNSFLLLTSTSLQNHPYKNIAQQEIAAEILIYSTEKIIFTDERLQFTYIHS